MKILIVLSLLMLSLVTRVWGGDITTNLFCSSTPAADECNNITESDHSYYPKTRGVLPIITMKTNELPDEIVKSLENNYDQEKISPEKELNSDDSKEKTSTQFFKKQQKNEN